MSASKSRLPNLVSPARQLPDKITGGVDLTGPSSIPIFPELVTSMRRLMPRLEGAWFTEAPRRTLCTSPCPFSLVHPHANALRSCASCTPCGRCVGMDAPERGQLLSSLEAVRSRLSATIAVEWSELQDARQTLEALAAPNEVDRRTGKQQMESNRWKRFV